MIYLLAASLVGNVGLALGSLWLLRTMGEDHNATVIGLEEANRGERHRLQVQLLALVSDHRTAVTVGMSQDVGSQPELKPVHYMDDAAMADYEEQVDRGRIALVGDDDEA